MQINGEPPRNIISHHGIVLRNEITFGSGVTNEEVQKEIDEKVERDKVLEDETCSFSWCTEAQAIGHHQ